MQSRTNLFTCPGGDTIQLLKTKEYLENSGIEVDISIELEPDLSKYDIIHLFNLTRVQETFIQVKNAKKQNKPVILSTIYWPSNEFEKKGQYGIRKYISNILSINNIESIKAFYKYVFKNERDIGTKDLITHKFTDMQKYILENSKYFLPNSKSEMDMIEKYIGYSTKNYNVVPNAVDINRIDDGQGEFAKYKDYIICVGRIETRKNQLNLLKSIKNTPYKLLIVGKIAPNHMKYGKKVMDEISKNPNVEYIESLTNQDIYKLYSVCKVHVLPSWYETPGLVSLEAAVMGCNIVVSDRGTTRDYFKKFAYYCEPDNIESIKKSIDKAYTSSYNSDLRDMIIKEYTWENTAKETIKGYKNILK